MKTVAFKMFIFLIIAFMFPFVFPLKDGRPMIEFSWNKVKPALPDVEMPKLELANKPEAEGEQPPVPEASYYRWKGNDGVMEFGSEPPTDGTPYEAVTVRTDANLITAQKPKPEAEPEAEQPAAELPSTADLYSVEGVKDIMDKAKAIGPMLEQRKTEQDAVLDNL